jgi:hypothetical protein
VNLRRHLLPYPEERALEQVAYDRGLTPTSVFAILLPVWQVEVRATTTDGRPYELIDRYLERGIAEAGLGTAAELTRFLALDAPLVDRALRVLTAIEHVIVREGRLCLTELGERSRRDGICYVVAREDRRKMYFDAFQSMPLTRGYYDPGVVTLLSAAEVRVAVPAGSYPSFQMLHSTRGFRREALTELAANPDRERYNLPVRIDAPQSLGEDLVYLPLFVVRAMDRQSRVRTVAFSQVSDTADEEITEIFEHVSELGHLLDTEENAARSSQRQDRFEKWFRGQGLTGHTAVRLPEGSWHVDLPSSCFTPDGPVSLAKVGSFVVQGTDLMRVWCADEATRKRAFVERIDSYAGSWSRRSSGGLETHIARVARQLDLRSIDIAALRRLAVKAGKTGLVVALDRLDESTG